MKLLLDTQLLLWAAGQPQRLWAALRKQLNNPRNKLVFSAASLLEIDRLLLAQAITEGITLLTGDAQMARYPGPVRKV
jgi:PIN domain nuclease of toxin-antitoxin system